MIQKRQLELVKYNDCDIKYHLGKVNVVVDALNRKVFLSQLMVQREIQIDLDLKQIKFMIEALAKLEINFTLVKKIKTTYLEDYWCKQRVQIVHDGLEINFQVDDSVLKF